MQRSKEAGPEGPKNLHRDRGNQGPGNDRVLGCYPGKGSLEPRQRKGVVKPGDALPKTYLCGAEGTWAVLRQSKGAWAGKKPKTGKCVLLTSAAGA